MVEIKTCEGMLNLPSHKGNANQKHIKIVTHSYSNASNQEHNIWSS
jgi:hypothetical protein